VADIDDEEVAIRSDCGGGFCGGGGNKAAAAAGFCGGGGGRILWQRQRQRGSGGGRILWRRQRRRQDFVCFGVGFVFMAAADKELRWRRLDVSAAATAMAAAAGGGGGKIF
jgi:hypothetical protein